MENLDLYGEVTKEKDLIRRPQNAALYSNVYRITWLIQGKLEC